MDLAARKYHFIEELLKVRSEDIMDRLEEILKPDDDISDYTEILSQRLKDYHDNPNDLLDWDDVKDKW